MRVAFRRLLVVLLTAAGLFGGDVDRAALRERLLNWVQGRWDKLK